MGMKQPGEAARLTYDTNLEVMVGDVVETETGRRYLVASARLIHPRNRPIRPAAEIVTDDHRPTFAHRYDLATVVLPPDHVSDKDDVVHPLRWNRR